MTTTVSSRLSGTRKRRKSTQRTETYPLIHFQLSYATSYPLRWGRIRILFKSRIWSGPGRRCTRCSLKSMKSRIFPRRRSTNIETVWLWCRFTISPFGTFKFSFEPTVDDNVYQITTYPGFHGGLARFLSPPNEQGIRLIEFKQHADFELPSRTLLDIHAALARIMHASGMGERIEEILRDRETLGCLAPDGSTDIKSLLIIPWEYPLHSFAFVFILTVHSCSCLYGNDGLCLYSLWNSAMLKLK